MSRSKVKLSNFLITSATAFISLLILHFVLGPPNLFSVKNEQVFFGISSWPPEYVASHARYSRGDPVDLTSPTYAHELTLWKKQNGVMLEFSGNAAPEKSHTTSRLAEDKSFQPNLKRNCSTKAGKQIVALYVSGRRFCLSVQTEPNRFSYGMTLSDNDRIINLSAVEAVSTGSIFTHDQDAELRLVISQIIESYPNLVQQ